LWCRETDMNYFGGVRTFKRGRKQICCFGFIFWWEFFFQFFFGYSFSIFRPARVLPESSEILERCLLDSKRPHSLPREICTLYNDFAVMELLVPVGLEQVCFFLLLVDGNGVGPASAFKHHRVASEVIAVHVQPCGLFRLNFFFDLRTGQPRPRRPRRVKCTDRSATLSTTPRLANQITPTPLSR